MPQYAIAQIAQIGCTGTEMGIAGLLIGGDFRIDSSAPRPAGGLTAGDPRERGCSKIVVFEKRNLERENGFSLGIACFAREKSKRFLRRRERIDERLVLLRHRPTLTCILLHGSQTHERTERNPGGGGPPLNATSRPLRSIVHPENL